MSNKYNPLVGLNLDYYKSVKELGTFPVLSADKFVETVKAHGTVSSGTETFNLNDGIYHIVTVGGNFTLAFSNWPTSNLSSITIKLINAGAYTITWPAAVKWPNGLEPSWTSSGIDFVIFFSDDNGTTISGTKSMSDVK